MLAARGTVAGKVASGVFDGKPSTVTHLVGVKMDEVHRS